MIAKEGVEANNTVGAVEKILVTLQLTAGQSPVDIGEDSSSGMLVVSYADSALYDPEVEWTKLFVGDDDEDNILEQHEKVQLEIMVPADSLLITPTTAANSEFRLEIKPKIGAIVPVTRVVPAQIDTVMVLK